MTTALATIAFVPRETLSQTLECLDTLIANTAGPYKLIAVAAGYPAHIVDGMRKRLTEVDGVLLEFDHYLTPNEARNAATSEVDTEYVVFVDHDVYVAKDWLESLTRCARETGAAIVGPLIFEGRPLFSVVHMLGGEAGIVQDEDAGGRRYHDIHHHAHQKLDAIDQELSRHETQLAEFHTVLVEVAWLRSSGGLDPEILSLAEHWDMAIQAAKDGRTIYVEPASRVSYAPPAKPTIEDKRWFAVRWSRLWNEKSIARLIDKHDLSADDPALSGLLRFPRGHHRRIIYRSAYDKNRQRLGRAGARLVAYNIAPLLDRYRMKRQLFEDLELWQRRRPAPGASSDTTVGR